MTEETPTETDEAPGSERVPGEIEQATDALFEKRGWRTVTLEQRGPDGTEVLAMLVFNICPVCSCAVPLGDEQNPLPDEHRNWHLGEAQALDEAATALKMLLEQAGIPQDQPKVDQAEATQRWGYEYRPEFCPGHEPDERGIQCVRCGGVAPYSGA